MWPLDLQNTKLSCGQEGLKTGPWCKKAWGFSLLEENVIRLKIQKRQQVNTIKLIIWKEKWSHEKTLICSWVTTNGTQTLAQSCCIQSLHIYILMYKGYIWLLCNRLLPHRRRAIGSELIAYQRLRVPAAEPHWRAGLGLFIGFTGLKSLIQNHNIDRTFSGCRSSRRKIKPWLKHWGVRGHSNRGCLF